MMCLSMYRSLILARAGVPLMDCTGGGKSVITISFDMVLELVLDIVKFGCLLTEVVGY